MANSKQKAKPQVPKREKLKIWGKPLNDATSLLLKKIDEELEREYGPQRSM